MSGLLLFAEPWLRSFAWGGAGVVLVAMLAALTLVPAMLALIGRRIRPARTDREGHGFFYRISRFVQRRALPYAQLVDERFQLADAIGQSRVPATLVLDRDGRVLYRGGAFDESALAAFRAALAAKPAGGGGDVTGSTGRLDHAAR